MRKDVYDYVGKKFGHLTVLAPVGVNEKHHTIVYCECDCRKHTNVVVELYQLVKGHRKTCGIQYLHSDSINNMLGKKYGKLTVIDVAYRKNWLVYMDCLCDCGNRRAIEKGSILQGNTTSCGCNLKTQNGMSHSRLYHVWRGIKNRCLNENSMYYADYGGRGITICEEWNNNFLSFYEWAINNGYDEKAERGKYTIDRIDNNGDYSPQNCRFVDMSVQCNNKRNVVHVEYNGELKTLKECSELTGIKSETLRRRYHNGDRGDDLFRAVLPTTRTRKE